MAIYSIFTGGDSVKQWGGLILYVVRVSRVSFGDACLKTDPASFLEIRANF